MSSVGRSLHKLFVGNLPWTVGNRELRQYFAQFGHVTSANVIYDRGVGVSKGYGFVVFSGRNSYDSVRSKPQHSLEGHVLTVQPATE